MARGRRGGFRMRFAGLGSSTGHWIGRLAKRLNLAILPQSEFQRLTIERNALAREVAELRRTVRATSQQARELALDLEQQRAATAATAAEREKLRFERDTLEVRILHVQQKSDMHRDVLLAERDGLAAVAADPTIDRDRRLAACDRHILAGGIDEVEALLESLRECPEHAPFVERGRSLCMHLRRSGMLDVLERVPNGGTGAAGAFCSPLRFRAPGADKIVLVFKSADSRFWLNYEQLFQALKRFGTHLIFLKDDHVRYFMHGIDGFGAGYQNSLHDLRALCRSFGDLPIYCIGSSMGAFGALRYGLDVGAEAVLALSPMTSLDASVVDRPLADEIWISRYMGEDAIDLRPLYAAAARVPRVTIYHGAQNDRDSTHARRFADIPGARIVALDGYTGHDSFAHLLAQQRLDQVFAEFLTASTCRIGDHRDN
jgi:hypothetical protein